jgi:cbb3-type cytochrome oxidase subunit 3
MNTLIVAGSMALLAIVGYIYFTYQDKKKAQNQASFNTDV